MAETHRNDLYEPETVGEALKADALETGSFDQKLKGADDDGKYPPRSANWRTAAAHIITAVIGSGVLGLGYSVAQVGWVFGPIILLMFAGITVYTTGLLCEAYRTGDEFTGKRNPTYMLAVRAHLGPRNQFFCALIQYTKLFSAGVGYTVTGSLCLVAAKRAVCFHHHSDVSAKTAPCSFDNLPWMIFFGALQIPFSQIPEFGSLWWLSYLAATMSFGYALIGLGLSIGKATEKGHHDYGTVLGANTIHSPATSTWNVFVALGSMAFAYNFSPILIEIADTLKQPPSEARSMRKATRVSVAISTIFYVSIATISYAGFGNASPGNLVTGFGFFNPYWLVAMANIFVFIHLIGGYQVYMQVFMDFVETQFRQLFPKMPYIYEEVRIPLPGFGVMSLSLLKLVSRSIIVCIATVIAIVLPFFNAIVSLLGAICFFPLTVYFPIQMHLVRRNTAKWTKRWTLLNALCIFAFLISACAAIGAVANIVNSLKVYKPFHSVSNSVAHN